MAHGQITTSVAEGAITGAAGGPIGIGIGAAAGYLSSILPGLLGGKKKHEQPAPPPLTESQKIAAWAKQPAHVAMMCAFVTSVVVAVYIVRRK